MRNSAVGNSTSDDPRRRIPRTDALLADERFADAIRRLGSDVVKAAIASAQNRARSGALVPEDVVAAALAELPVGATTLRPIINATGVVVHTNIGRAPLSPAAIEAMNVASGYVDVEFDPQTARRASRGHGTLEALLEEVPAAESALVVNNGAAALLLACLALTERAARELASGDAGGDGSVGRAPVIVSRGELIEIGDGFRLPELLQSAGIRLIEVGMTNRTHLRDYEEALKSVSGAGVILKIHTSNYRVEGFAGVPGVAQLAQIGAPLIADVGSGLLAPERVLPDEPDAATWLKDGATVVTASGDKLLGGPQAGIVLGDGAAVESIRRHPMARAMRADKLALAALEATLRGPIPPVMTALRQTRDSLRDRTDELARRIEDGLSTQRLRSDEEARENSIETGTSAVNTPAVEVVEVIGRVGGGGAPGFDLPSLAVAIRPEFALPLRTATPCVLARVANGRCLIDLRCVPPESDGDVLAAVLAAAVTQPELAD